MTIAGVPKHLFRDGMARLGSSVNVITSDGPCGRLGFTATSVCSLSDDPPSLLVCMNRSSAQNAPFKSNGVLCVNVLTPEHKDLSAAFAGAGKLDSDGRFALGSWSSLKTGAPVLDGAVACFDCAIRATVEASTHSILICDVVEMQLGEIASSMIYFMRDYHSLLLSSADPNSSLPGSQPTEEAYVPEISSARQAVSCWPGTVRPLSSQ